MLSLEEWDMARPMARMVITPPQGQPMLPDHPNWTWHEYGMRVGFWRMKRMLDALKIKPTVTLNARVCETYPQVVQACVDAGWELNAHGYDQMPMHKLDDQKAVIDKSVAIIAKFWGRAPRGWFGPGLTQTFDTLDHLSAAGIEYIGDWVLDDEPVTLEDHAQAGGGAAVQFRTARHRADGARHHPSDQMYLPRDGPVRVPLCGIGRAPEDHGDRHASVICPGCRTGSITCGAPSRRSWPGRVSRRGMAPKFWIGTRVKADRC